MLGWKTPQPNGFPIKAIHAFGCPKEWNYKIFKFLK